MGAPLVSIVVRSCNRPQMLFDLLPRLLAQRWPAIEVVVVEQSTNLSSEDRVRLAALAAADARLWLLARPPLGGAAARNEGARHARGEFLLFVDDDDAPLDDGWVAAHLRNYDDPACLGVVGRLVLRAHEEPPYRNRDLAYRRLLMFTPLLRLPWSYARMDRRKQGIEASQGSNFSLRASAIARFGLWDDDVRIEDEASFCYRLARRKREDEYLVFDPTCVALRGFGAEGGLAKRQMTAAVYARRYLEFVHHVVARYHRVRIVLLYPLYLAGVVRETAIWTWGDSQAYASHAGRAAGVVWAMLTLPGAALGLLLAPRGRRGDDSAR